VTGEKRGVRLHIEYTKRNGKRASFWADAPEDWDLPRAQQQSWAATAAAKHHPGATDVSVIGRE
jgi:hypothetical protein